jgi:hypothetical protein
MVQLMVCLLASMDFIFMNLGTCQMDATGTKIWDKYEFQGNIGNDLLFVCLSTGNHFNPHNLEHGGPEDENRVGRFVWLRWKLVLVLAFLKIIFNKWYSSHNSMLEIWGTSQQMPKEEQHFAWKIEK